MQFYYLLENGLEGPVTARELNELLIAGTLEPDTPVWCPLEETWTSCSAANLAAEGTALMQFDDSALNTTTAFTAHLDRTDLPVPEDLLALRYCAERQFITAHQYRRQLDAALAQASRQDREESYESALTALERRGWISGEQRSSIEQDLLEDTVPTRIAGYEIQEELGRGGMGITYRARQIAMDRIVALKVLLPRWSQDADYIDRFRREAQMAARLNHENIATAYEVGEDGGQHFFSMEYVEGRNLDTILEEQGLFAEEEVARIGIQICRALAHAFELGVIHRDISAKNIIIKDDGVAKVIDMGLAKSIESKDSRLTSEGLIIGTPAYMSPERARGEDHVDIRSDIYSLGCVFYEMLTGEAPLVGGTKYETISLHMNQPVPNVKKVRPELSDLIAHLVQKMTAFEPEGRFQTPEEVIAAFGTDAETARVALIASDEVPPVQEQLAAWTGESVEIRLLVDWREYTHVIGQALDQRLEAAGVDHEFQGLAQTIFGELVANAFDHGCQDLDTGVVVVRLELNNAFFRVEVIDPGPGFAAQEMLKRLRTERVDRERQRGIFQVAAISEVRYSKRGNHVKAVMYRKTEGSGIHTSKSGDITYVEIKGKGDLALAESFKRWVENYNAAEPERMCLMVRTDWVSSMFVGTIGKLEGKMDEVGSALSVWVEHRSCFRIMQQLGITSFVHVYDSLEAAEMALRYKTIGRSEAASLATAETAEVDAVQAPASQEAAADTSSEDAPPKRRKTSVIKGQKRRRTTDSGLLARLKKFFS